jgi:DNA-binding XRE family transcriptional regulator
MNPKAYALIRKDIGTQAEVADMLQVARETIARRETGVDRITREAALAMMALEELSKKGESPDV